MYELSVKTYTIFLFIIIFSFKCYAQDEQTFSNSFSSNSLTFRTNIPTWFLAVPSIGVAYKISDHLEIATDAAISTWNFKRAGRSNFWRNWNVSPQVRTFINSDRSTYLGIQYSVGQYNISKEQGNYTGGGLTIGKQYYAGKKMLIDLGVTLGYLKLTEREKYIEEDNLFYRIERRSNHYYWGPTALSIRLSRKVN